MRVFSSLAAAHQPALRTRTRGDARDDRRSSSRSSTPAAHAARPPAAATARRTPLQLRSGAHVLTEQKENFPAFRSQLLESLKEGGRATSRSRRGRAALLQEIRRQGLLRSARPARDVPVRQRALDSLVLDHLAACGYAYSLSVFAPEADSARRR